MDISGSCPRPTAAARPVRGPHGGWQQQEIDRLHQCISEGARTGESLRSVFERVAIELGRKPNSIRNFYYAQLREQDVGDTPRTLPFETFSQEEVETLLEQVLTARAQGMSVRACVRKLSGGDKTRMLRYQNKYRSTVRSRPDIVRRVMERLAQNGVPYVSPYPREGALEAQDALPRLKSRAMAADDVQLAGFFEGLEHLLDLALANKATQAGIEQPIQEIPQKAAQDNMQENMQAGIQEDMQAAPDHAPSPVSVSEQTRRADRLRAHCDMLRIALSDEQQRIHRLREETGGMLTLIRSYIALPSEERSEKTQAFCQQAQSRLAAVECAMME